MPLHRRRPPLILTASALLALSSFAAARDAARGQRFNSPGVLDLARHAPLLNGKVSVIVPLDAGVAQQILATPTRDQEHATLPFSNSLFGCAADAKTCVAEHERRLLAASAGTAKRDGEGLAIKPGAAAAIVFVDWSQPTTKTADGDAETHWYLGTLPGSGLHQIEVQFGHDAPGSFLINPQNGKSAFVHSGSDIVALSPDGMHLVTFNPDNPPVMLRVAALDASGPRLELECTARDDDRSTALFKGWHDDRTFDLVLLRAPGVPSPLRLSRADAGWTLAGDAPQLRGFACRQ